MDDSLYKNDIEEPFSQEIKHQFIENDREFDGEEEEIDTTIPAREELFEIIERINNFDGETMTDDTMNAISNLADFTRNCPHDFSKIIRTQKIFSKLVQILNFVHENGGAVFSVIDCLAVLTGQDPQENDYFKDHFDLFKITFQLLNDPIFFKHIIVLYTNIISDQVICRNFILKNLTPTKIHELIQQYINDFSILTHISRFLAACAQYNIDNLSLISQLTELSIYLINIEPEQIDNEEAMEVFDKFRLYSLYACHQFLILSENETNKIAGSKEFVQKLISIIEETKNIRVAERSLLIISHLATADNFDPNLLSNEFLLNLYNQTDESFLRVLNRCIRQLLINNRMLMDSNDVLFNKLNHINEMLLSHSFIAKNEVCSGFEIILSSSTPEFVHRLITAGFLQTLLLLKDINRRDGIKNFLSICRYVFSAPIPVGDKEQAGIILNFFGENEIFQYFDEIEEEYETDESIMGSIEMLKSQYRNLKEFVESTE